MPTPKKIGIKRQGDAAPLSPVNGNSKKAKFSSPKVAPMSPRKRVVTDIDPLILSPQVVYILA